MGIFCSRAAFSLPAGPRRSFGYACGRQVAAALPENKIYPFKTASNLENKGGFFCVRAAFSAGLWLRRTLARLTPNPCAALISAKNPHF